MFRIFLLSATLAAAALHAAELAIDNSLIRVRFTTPGNTYTLAALPSGRVFVPDGSLGTSTGTARVQPIDDSTFGRGTAIAINGVPRILLFPKLPFALFRDTVRSPLTDRFQLPAFTPELGNVPLKVLGTGGLADAAKATGSYMWLTVADPTTRHGVVTGWITSERGSGVVFPESTEGRLRVRPQIDYGKLRLAPGAEQQTETLAVGYFDDARLGMEAWADAVAKVYDIHLPPQPDGYCTWYHARASSEKELPQQAAFAAEQLKPFGLSFLQIDDGWQDGEKLNGPKKNFTRINPAGPYPHGMQATAAMIRSHGFTPGIWWMPFAGTFNDPWFAQHQDWFAKREDGKPYDVFWGGTSLDMSHPGAREYVAATARTLSRDWGFKYFKMDGLWTGSATEMQYVNAAYRDDHIGNAVLHNPDKTNVEVYRDGLKLVREAAGRDVFFLGCNTAQNMRVYGASFGLVDAMRIGPDNGPGWKSLLVGPLAGSHNYHLHGRVWYNDPDPLYVRASMPIEHARLIASWVAVSGQFSVSSDAYAALPADRLDILKRTLPSHHAEARPVDLFEQDLPRVWHVRGGEGRDIIGLFNWDAKPATIEYSAERLGLPNASRYEAFEFWSNAPLPSFSGTLKVTVPPQSAMVIAVRPESGHPQVLSTSRHITQGVIDLKEERWSGDELSGVSQTVAGDPYELRISTAGRQAVAASADDAVADIQSTGGILRVTLRPNATTSSGGKAVKWRVRFAARR